MQYIKHLIDTIAHPKTGKAMRYDPTELYHTGHDVWVAQRAREELQKLQDRIAILEKQLNEKHG